MIYLGFVGTESEERLKTVISSAPLVIWALNTEGIFTFSDGQGLQSLGLNSSQVVGTSVFELYKDYPELIKKIKKALTGEEVYYISNIEGIFFDIRIVPNYNEYGELVGITGIAIDVTQQKNSEKALFPFYTTKKIGQGTGLGLSVSYKIITKQHQGKITCKSKPGQGSEFIIEIPVKLGN